MANPLRGEASFEALGETWTLRFNNNAICEFEDTAKVSLSSLAGEGGMRISHVRALVWAGLGHHHRGKRAGLDHVGRMMDEIGTDVIAAVALKALASAFPDKTAATANPPEAAQG